MTSCTAIRILQLKSFDADKATAIDPSNIRVEATLNIVGRVVPEVELIYDEGETRLLYREVTLTIESVIGSDFLGVFVEGELDPDPSDFKKNLTDLTAFLSTQGLVLDIGGYPDGFLGLVNGGNLSYPYNTPSTDYTGYLVDSFNGPRTVGITLDTIAGSTNVLLTWKVKFKTSWAPNAIESEYLRKPRATISSELRLDIDTDGDLSIIFSGTVYSATPRLIYEARDWLDIKLAPLSTEHLYPQTRDEIVSQDKFAQYNGFFKDVTFDVEKNGRSAKFSINYKQVKSNSAFPLGIRDIEFVQELESSMLNKNAFTGAGFTTWKQTLSGSIRIPHRMPIHYAWYVINLIVAQKMRYSVLKLDSLEEQSKDSVVKVSNSKTSVMPLRIKLTNSVYKRQLKFQYEYVVVSPLDKVLYTTCFFDRVNNDYQRKLNDPDADYIPVRLSNQWLAWQASIDPAFRFDPTQPYGFNLFGSIAPHRDNMGSEILDTGHNYNPYDPLANQDSQKVRIITTVTDPNEIDPAYQYPTSGSFPLYYGQNKQVNFTPDTSSGTPISSSLSVKETLPSKEAVVVVDNTRNPYNISRDVSWLKFNQKYIITESNPTLPVEALAAMDDNHFTSKKSFTELMGEGVDDAARALIWNDAEGLPKVRSSVNPYTGTEHYGFIDRPTDEEEFEEPVGQDPAEPKFFRKTYSAKPGRFFLTVQGMAMRVKYKIAIPSVISIGGEPAIRVGQSKTSLEQVGTSGDMPIYLAMWEQHYTIDKSMLTDDIIASIKTSGAEAMFV